MCVFVHGQSICADRAPSRPHGCEGSAREVGEVVIKAIGEFVLDWPVRWCCGPGKTWPDKRRKIPCADVLVAPIVRLLRVVVRKQRSGALVRNR